MSLQADRYAVFGNPVGHSKSPRIHTLFAAQTGQSMRYEAILAPLDGFAASVRDFISAGGRGANVTVPFKEEAFRLATQLTPRAQAAGAVNTLSFSGDDITGDNTDGAGLVRDITSNLAITLEGKRVLLLGAGGATRGVIFPILAESPQSLTIANRTAEKAAQLATELATMFARLPNCACPIDGGGFESLTGRSFDIVINATSAGLSDAALPIDASVFAAHGLAYEMLYGRETPFMALARSAGIRVADGLGMLVEQAAEAFAVWRGVRPQTAPVLAELRAVLAT